MAINYPGPYEIRLFYTAVYGGITYNHETRMSIEMSVAANPGDPFSDWTVELRDGSGKTLDVVVDELVALYVPNFHTSTTFVRAELWQYVTGTFDANFLSTYTVGEAGTSGSATSPDAQLIFQFRTTAGGFAKIDLRHSIDGEAVPLSYPTGSARLDDLIDYLIAANTPMLGRDNSYVFSPLAVQRGRNEKLARDRLRP